MKILKNDVFNSFDYGSAKLCYKKLYVFFGWTIGTSRKCFGDSRCCNIIIF